MGQFAILLGALPALLVMWYFDRLDAKRPEPRWALRRVALAGAISFLPCVFLELLIDKIGPHGGVAGGLYKGFIVAAAVEELAKVLCMRWFVWNRPEFDERMDGITYGTRAGLGFALGSLRRLVAFWQPVVDPREQACAKSSRNRSARLTRRCHRRAPTSLHAQPDPSAQ